MLLWEQLPFFSIFSPLVERGVAAGPRGSTDFRVRSTRRVVIYDWNQKLEHCLLAEFQSFAQYVLIKKESTKAPVLRVRLIFMMIWQTLYFQENFIKKYVGIFLGIIAVLMHSKCVLHEHANS